jgi:dolichol-phosphate mannosyltransferase
VDGAVLANWPRHRWMLSRLANAYVRLVMGLPVRDCTAGMRCWRPSTLARLSLDTLQSNGYAFQVETLHRTLRLGDRVREVPITFAARERGSSKLTGRVLLEAAALPWHLRASTWSGVPAPSRGVPADAGQSREKYTRISMRR